MSKIDSVHVLYSIVQPFVNHFLVPGMVKILSYDGTERVFSRVGDSDNTSHYHAADDCASLHRSWKSALPETAWARSVCRVQALAHEEKLPLPRAVGAA
ncbi:MAG: hypothetical protein KatS3mg056_0051 [Chloroflexus sp.]|nr:MAG: hypothetical protein KatS3mg056_0051 [Chloroflexus sp.]